MSEARCPMCGKLNSEQAEVCGFCQARLRPLFVNNASDDEAEVPSWLTALGGSEKEQPASAPSLPVTDWLAGLRRDVPSNEDNQDEAEEEADFSSIDADPNRQVPEWLKGILPEVEPVSTDQEAAEAKAEPFDASELDWSADLAQVSDEQQAYEPSPLPDWLAGFDQPVTEKTPDLPETPPLDWLAADAHPLVNEASPPVSSGADQILPREKILPPDELEESPTLDAAGEEISFPDWLKGISQQSNTPLVQEYKESLFTTEMDDTGEGGSLPEWLNDVEQSLAAESDTSDFPDWLAKASHPSDIVPPSPGDEEGAIWTPPTGEPALNEEDAGARFHFPGLQSPLEAPSAVTPGSAQLEDIPPVDLSWLDEMEANVAGVEFSAEQPGFLSGEANAPLPAIAPDTSSDAFTPVSPLPTWLTQSIIPEEAAPQAEAAEAAETGLAPVELPGWLKSMQPTATIDALVRTQAEKEQIEGAGPLSGLSGVLPAEPDIVRVTKPTFYSSKLKVTDLQQTQAMILSDLIQTEGETKALPSMPFLTSQGLLRISIGAILIVVMLFSMISGMPVLIEPGLTQDVYTVQQLINGLPVNAPVLVVVDYSPGYSSEMNMLLGAVIDHLATKNKALAFVSSIPTGPLQVESLIAQVKKRPNFILPLKYTNLGFIPGEAAGILAFVQDPIQTLPEAAWNTEGWQTVHSLADIALLIIATENPETARVWIEQGRTFTLKVPFV